MPKFTVTKYMGACLKTLRIKKNIKAIEIAKHIRKTGAYISKLENGVLNTIEDKDLYNIIRYLSSNDQETDETLTLILQDSTLTYSKKESEQEEWILNLEYFYRKIPVPIEYINFVNDKLSKNDITIDMLISYINENHDLYNNPDFSKEQLDNSEKNHWYFNNGKSFTVMDLSKDKVTTILNNRNVSANYATLFCILLSLYRLEDNSVEDSYHSAHIKLQEFNILFLSEKIERMNSYPNLNQKHTILDQRENENLPEHDRKLLNQLYEFTEQCHTFAELHDTNYVNKKLETLITNFRNDPILIMGCMGIDLSALKDCNITIKKEFVHEIQHLVKDYSTKSGITDELI